MDFQWVCPLETLVVGGFWGEYFIPGGKEAYGEKFSWRFFLDVYVVAGCVCNQA